MRAVLVIVAALAIGLVLLFGADVYAGWARFWAIFACLDASRAWDYDRDLLLM